MNLTTQVAMPPIIETERFMLRPLRASDAGLLSMYAGDERVARFTRTIPHPLPPGSTEAFIKRVLTAGNPNQTWALDGSNSDLSEVLGVISLTPMERNQSKVGYWVAPSFWGTGLASGALRAIIEVNPQNSKTLFAEVFQDNAASARVVTNNGFEYLGDAETFCIARNAIVPTWTYLRSIK